MNISEMAASLKGSEILKLATEINELKRQGVHVYNLTIGDFDPEIFPIPDRLKEEISRYYAANATNYPASNGMLELREAVAAYIKNRQGLEYDSDSFLISSGARPLIFATYMALLDPGDKVIYPVPSWNNNHYTHIGRGEGVPVLTAPEDNFMPTAALLAPYVETASLVALCSPLNPTGTLFSAEQLQGICELVLAENKRRGPGEKPLYLLYDQIYWNLTYGESKHVDPVSLVPEIRPYTIYIDGMSKAFCATGLRIGWGFGPKEVIGRMKALLAHAGAWSARAEQLAAAAYLNATEIVDQDLENNRKKLEARLQAFYHGITAIRAEGYPVDAIPPQAALYLTVKLDLKDWQTPGGESLNTGKAIYAYLLAQANMAIVPFYAFGADADSPWFRLSVGTAKMEEIPEILARLKQALSRLTRQS